MGLMKEFKDFALKGNVIDLAIGVVIGAAFGAIVKSLVEDILTPVILKPALEAAGVVKIEDWAPGGVLAGKFIAAVISFVIVAFLLFLLVKGINAAKKKEETAPAPTTVPSNEEKLLTEIRDLLKK